MSTCIRQSQITELFADRLSEQDQESLLLHLTDCPICEAAAESWWRHQGLGLALCAVPELPTPDTLRAQRRLLRALNRPEAGGYFIALLTQGLVQSVLTLLEPIFGMLLGSEPSAAD